MISLKENYRAMGFSEPPFNQTPDTDFFYLSKQHLAALYHLQYGMLSDGFTMLTGEVGLGKTLLCRQLLKIRVKGIKTVYIYNTYINLVDLLKSIYYDLTGIGLVCESSGKCFYAINQVLLRMAKEGEKVVIVIDEAHCLEPGVLEGLRHLSNLETEKSKLLSFLMVGQPELEKRLAKKDMRQLAQRISVRHVLKPLAYRDTRDYIDHRMKLAAANSAVDAGQLVFHYPSPFFSEYAKYMVYRYSRGVPRRINQICDRALLACAVKGDRKIGSWTVRRAAREILG